MTRIIPTNFTGGTLSLNFNDILEQIETRFLNEDGDTLRGELNMNGHQIKNVGDPIDSDDAIPKKYLTDLLEDIKFQREKLDTSINTFKSAIESISKTIEAHKNEGDTNINTFKSAIESISKTIEDLKNECDTNINKFKSAIESISKTIEDYKIKSDQNIISLQAPLLDEIKKTKENIASLNLQLTSVSSLERLKAYQIIQKMPGLKFWISGYYPKGFHHQSSNNFVDLSNSSQTGENIAHQGQLELRIKDYPCIFLDGETNIRSSFVFSYEYTFFLLGRKLLTKASGRLFSSEKGNNVLGWWESYDQTLWANQEIYRKKHSADKEIHLWIVRVFNKDPESDKGEITFYDGDFHLVTTSFYKTKYYNVVLGQPVLYKKESLKGYIYEVICFDYGLKDEEIETVRNFIKTYYSYKKGFN